MTSQEQLRVKRHLYTIQSQLQEIDPIWLQYIEPYIIRKGYEPHWLWNGQLDRNDYPLIYDPYIEEARKLARRKGDPIPARKQVSLKNWIAHFFYDIPPRGWFVTNNRELCPTFRNCVNPLHIYVTQQHPRWL